MLEQIPARYTRALLSNSNVLHWPRVLDEMGLRQAIEHRFVSHLTGRIKPDDDAFLHVTQALGCVPGEVLFLDDNRLNVDAARRLGMNAELVEVPGGAGRAHACRGDLAVMNPVRASLRLLTGC